ncbi:unnamed protein product [Caenorhabditis auriculariae]|uniref:Uncharacterized protein n=1 Tax=Caenorhabditis auriculariae TaxID=2777116 RepID=A0A8S1HKN8_9PELO|nr:unnamed protein product [Caenorhabditis auriculariae]
MQKGSSRTQKRIEFRMALVLYADGGCGSRGRARGSSGALATCSAKTLPGPPTSACPLQLQTDTCRGHDDDDFMTTTARRLPPAADK